MSRKVTTIAAVVVLFTLLLAPLVLAQQFQSSGPSCPGCGDQGIPKATEYAQGTPAVGVGGQLVSADTPRFPYTPGLPPGEYCLGPSSGDSNGTASRCFNVDTPDVSLQRYELPPGDYCLEPSTHAECTDIGSGAGAGFRQYSPTQPNGYYDCSQPVPGEGRWDCVFRPYS